jgi:hypothetical protein
MADADNSRKMTHRRPKTAGEVRFIKDRGSDDKSWGWGNPGPTNREIKGDFEFDPKNLKPLAKVLRASLASMGHALSAYDAFTRVKSAQISPDGSLGGKGYIQKIADMRRQYMNVVEALSSLSDTLYDEMHAPHWDPAVEEQSVRERDQVKNIMDDVEDIRENPEAWAEEAEEGMSEDDDESAGVSGVSKLARAKTAGTFSPSRLASRYLARGTKS